MTGTRIQINSRIQLDVWYERGERAWYGRYINSEGDQIGDAWHGYSRDEVIVFRSAEPV